MSYRRLEDCYDVGDLLGKGGFSRVFKGVDRKTQEQVALKMIPAKVYTGNEWARQLLRTEVRVMTEVNKLGHPNLIRFYHVFEDSHKVVIVLELLSDDLLTRVLQKGHYSERDASKLLDTIIRALDALHGLNILHRDLKPENCIFAASDDCNLKIADFGLAASLGPSELRIKSRCRVGTAGYLAPEVIDTHEYSAASDVWAVGVILYILLCGSAPFRGRSHKEIFHAIRSAKWGFRHPNWAAVSDRAKDLVSRMLESDPRKRISVPEILQHPWIKELHTLPVAHLAAAMEGLRVFNARRKFRVAALACYAAVHMQRLVPRRVSEELSDLVPVSVVFTSEELENLHQSFTQATGPSSRSLNFESFKTVMESLKLGHLPLARIFKVFDMDDSGEVDYAELLLGLSNLRLQGEEAIKFCFTVFDLDKSGAITLSELTNVLVHMWVPENRPPSPPHPMAAATPTPDAEGTQPPPAAVGSSTTTQGACEHDPATGMLRYDERFIEMDPDAYQVAEAIAELFAELDENGDEQVTLDEFMRGAQKRPELLEMFFKPSTPASVCGTRSGATTVAATSSAFPPAGGAVSASEAGGEKAAEGASGRAMRKRGRGGSRDA